MARIDALDYCHGLLVQTCEDTFKATARPMPITIVSMNDDLEDQVVVVDTRKFSLAEVAKRLRLAADLVDLQSQ